MGDHVRKQIRDGLVAAVTGLTTTGSHVFTGRVIPMQSIIVPTLLVFTNSEGIERTAKGGIQGRYLTAIIEGHVKEAVNVVDKLDMIAVEVEKAIGGAGFLGGLVKAVDLVSVEIELSGGAEQPTGVLRLEYSINYHTQQNAPDVAL